MGSPDGPGACPYLRLMRPWPDLVSGGGRPRERQSGGRHCGPPGAFPEDILRASCCPVTSALRQASP